MAGVNAYPKRDVFFSHRFVRLLQKSCAAQDIGANACLFLCYIVHTEDAARYTGPVRFWNEQLMNVMGFKSPKQLNDARSKAESAGWLVYERSGNREVGRYWVRIPPDFEGLSDTVIEENHSAIHSAGGMNSGMNTERIPERLGDGSRNEFETESGKPSNPIPNPIPNPDTHNTTDAAASDACVVITNIPEAPEPPQKAPLNFLMQQFTCAFGGVLRGSDKRQKAANQRWKDVWWRENWQAALDRGSQSPFLRGDSGGWKISFDWFLKPDSVSKIMEGNYDETTNAQRPAQQTAAERREQLNATGFNWIREAAERQQQEQASTITSGHLGCAVFTSN
jgi:hypothetical protein